MRGGTRARGTPRLAGACPRAAPSRVARVREGFTRRPRRRRVLLLPQGVRGAGGGHADTVGRARTARVAVRGTEPADARPDAGADLPSAAVRRGHLHVHRDGPGFVRADVEGAGEQHRQVHLAGGPDGASAEGGCTPGPSRCFDW